MSARTITATRCGCSLFGKGACTCWTFKFSDELIGSATVVDQPIGVNSLRVVPLKSRARTGTFAIRRNGTVPGLAESPCDEWRRIIKRRYAAGFRSFRLVPASQEKAS